MKITKRQLRRIIREQCSLSQELEISDGGYVQLEKSHGEASMARGQLARSAEISTALLDIIDDEDDLPEWVESKITLAQDYLGTVLDYIKGREGS